MVYGAHAHQIQQVEFYKSKPIFFGLGNFVFIYSETFVCELSQNGADLVSLQLQSLTLPSRFAEQS